MRLIPGHLIQLTESILNIRTSLFVVVLLLAQLIVADTGIANAQKPVNPSQVQTAYLYHFMRFTQWPESKEPTDSESYKICIAQSSVENNFIDSITQKTIGNHQISIAYIKESDSLDDCHLLYLADISYSETDKYLTRIKNLPVLSVGTTTNFLKAGGMIALHSRKGQVTFSVNLKAVTNASLKLSANMLDVAEKVIK